MLVLIFLVLSGRSCNLQICSLSRERDVCTFPVSADKLSTDISATTKPYCASVFLAWSLCCFCVLSLCSEYTGYVVIQTVDFKNYNQTSKQSITTMIINSKQLDWTSVFPLRKGKKTQPQNKELFYWWLCAFHRLMMCFMLLLVFWVLPTISDFTAIICLLPSW